MSLQTRLDLALDYARKGYYVHPLCWPTIDGRCACGRQHTGNEIGKRPLAPHGSDDATRDEATILAWWDEWPEANIGFNLEKSGLVDIAPDCSRWAQTFKANGMPRTAYYLSGSGWHTLYRRPKDCPIHRICKTGEYDLMSSGNTVAPGSAHKSGRLYCLMTELPPVEELPEAPAWAIQMLRDAEQAGAKSGDLDMALVEKRRGNIDVILARVMPTIPRMARDALEHPDRCPSYSEARYRVIGGLMHLPNEEIAALIHYWADTDKLPWGHLEGKSQKQKNGDIVRCIGKHEARMSGRGYPRVISPTRAAGLLPAQPLTKPRARQDRPQRLNAGQLLAWYKQEAHSGVVLMTQAEVAAAHGISTRTVIRLEQKLDGQIERVSKQHASFVRVRTSSDNIAAVSDLENADTSPPSAENEPEPLCTNTLSLSEEPRESLALGHDADGRRLGLADLIRDGLDACGNRPTLKRVRAYVTLNAANPDAYSEGGIALVYQRELKRRQLDRQIAALPTMKYGKFKALSRRVERILAEGEEGACYGWANWLHPYVEAEFERRMEAKERLRTGRRGATVDEALLLAEIQEARRRPVIPEKRRAGRTKTGSVPVPTAQPPQLDLFSSVPEAPAPLPGTPASLLASIRALQAQLFGASP